MRRWCKVGELENCDCCLWELEAVMGLGSRELDEVMRIWRRCRKVAENIRKKFLAFFGSFAQKKREGERFRAWDRFFCVSGEQFSLKKDEGVWVSQRVSEICKSKRWNLLFMRRWCKVGELENCDCCLWELEAVMGLGSRELDEVMRIWRRCRKVAENIRKKFLAFFGSFAQKKREGERFRAWDRFFCVSGEQFSLKKDEGVWVSQRVSEICKSKFRYPYFHPYIIYICSWQILDLSLFY